MSETLPQLNLSLNANGKPVVLVDGAEVSADTLAAKAPALATPEGLGQYCDALNHLARGEEYHVIHDPAAYADKYRQRLSTEDPDAPFVEGEPRLSDFGVCDTSEITPPKLEGEHVVFFAEDDYWGIPYRVVGPAPTGPGGALQYEPVTME